MPKFIRDCLRSEPRIGRNGEEFTMYKLGLSAGRFALDELGQALNIWRGDMAAFGWRPLAPEEHVEFMDSIDPVLKARYERLVLPTLPGVFSTFAITYHGGLDLPEADKYTMRAESNIKDVVDQPRFRKIRILLAAASE